MKKLINSAIDEPVERDSTHRSSKAPHLPLAYRVISEADAASYCDLSLVHFRRLRRERMGPRHVRLSQRRIGYRLHDVLNWLEERLG